MIELDQKKLEILIPSEYVRNYIEETNWIFSDKEIAVLAYHSEMILKEKYNFLKSISENTSDQILAAQIENYLDDLRRQFEDFKIASKDDGRTNYIYILYLDNKKDPKKEDLFYGYYTDWSIACKAGRHIGERRGYTVKKHEIVTGYDYPDRDCLAAIHFNDRGKATFLFSEEAELTNGDHGFDSEFFTQIYIEIPNPFEKGDIVKCTDSGKYGIVNTSQKEWREKAERNRDYIYAEWRDNRISIDVVTKEGFFVRTDVCPLELELYKPENDFTTAGLLDKLLLTASDVRKGIGCLSDFSYYQSEYKIAMMKGPLKPNEIIWALHQGYLDYFHEAETLENDTIEQIRDFYKYRLFPEIKMERDFCRKTKKDENGACKTVGFYAGYLLESYENAMRRHVRESHLLEDLDPSAAEKFVESFSEDGEIDYNRIFMEAGQLPHKIKDHDNLYDFEMIVAVRSEPDTLPHFYVFRNMDDKKAWQGGISLSMLSAAYFPDENNGGKLKKSELRLLKRYLKSKYPIDTEKTMWEALIEAWNHKNGGSVGLIPMPDYMKTE